ncbi:unnamed protein product [Hyaloperonospora brassicae]|uniref:Uncharacterized protein n=1 Tax=Hyaloperonospora brassicae TaxID=162125 RepID=A0AAV0U4L7_HYABA|nr:unnamed protein product [Hyaloperonospora brassicae]
MAIVFGHAIDAFGHSNGTVDLAAVNEAALWYLYIALALFATDYVAYVAFTASAERQVLELRDAAFAHLLHLDLTWYDARDPLTLASHLTGDTVKVKDGMGSKLGEAVKYVCQFCSGYGLGLLRVWDLTLVMACVMPVMVLSLSALVTSLRLRATQSQQLYAEAGAVAEETLGSIRTVASLTAEPLALAKYKDCTAEAEQSNIHMARFTAWVYGLFVGSIWFMYAAGLWYGGSKVVDDDATPGEVFQAFFAVLMGTISMGQIMPNVSAIAEARGAAVQLYAILDTPSLIDASKTEEAGDVPAEMCRGRIEAVGVQFAYPSRPDVRILNNYNVTIEAGQTVAFVGPSGSGKSTLIALLERFYDPNEGTLLLDGRDVKTLSVKWLRAQIGLVSQEPVLFASTILENIAAGREHCTLDEVIAAAKLANAHTFIMDLPEQYDTLVGEKGVTLSGGQKQRIAIARAIVREPKILVLDEATSALDAGSEQVVQAALNDLIDKTRMTTLVIAHRLSTIRRADKIVVVDGGQVVEEGPHDELVAIKDGTYRKLYLIQEERAQEEARVAVTTLSEVESTEPHLGSSRSHSGRSVNSSIHGRKEMESPDEEETSKKEFTIFDIMALSRSEKPLFIVGTIAAAIVGCSLPASAVLISGLISSLTANYALYKTSNVRSALDDLSHDVTVYGLCYVGGGFVMFLASGAQNYCFKYMAEKLTSRLRDIHFTALCRQNIGFFDEKENAKGALTADLSTNAMKVALISGESQGRVVQAFCTFVAALLISFTTGSWLLTFVMLSVFPLLVFGQVARMRQLTSSGHMSDELAEVGAYASEALSNIRTVVSLGLEKSLCAKFSASLQQPLASGRREAQVNGLALGFGSFILFSTYSLVFWYGGKLVDSGDISFKQLMRTLMAIIMSAQGIGNSASFMGDFEKAVKAGKVITDLRDRQPPIDSFQEGGRRLDRLEGKIEFKNILFRYPTRPDVTVLRNYSVTIEAGQTVAFCGPSGGGKSTGISLLERFYDPTSGQVLLDGVDTKELNLKWLRSQIGLVGQEPTLFIGTIAENIAYGLTNKPTRQEIEEAAKMANAHGFVTQFPDGYDTQVGMKGEQLSGGQKQRIAISRAILKNPNILLLDEATSALDSESEKIVQNALDKVVASKRRTTIIIAHRLSTIRNADKICVVSGGKIAEQGTHQELVRQDGIYAKLVKRSVN